MMHCTGKPTEEFLEAYLQGALPEAAAQSFEEHYFDCAVCLGQVEALQAVASKLASEPRPSEKKMIAWPLRVSLWGAIAATLLLGWVGLRVWHSSLLRMDEKALEQITTPHPSVAKQGVTASLRDGTLELALDENGQLRGAESLPLEAQNALHAALVTGRLTDNLPVTDKSKNQETMLGAYTSPAPFKLLSPVNRTVLEAQPKFAWEPLPLASGYRVRIYAAGYRKVSESPLLQATEWRSPNAFPRGADYTWTVSAEGPHGTVREPAPPEPEAAFHIVGAEAATQIEEALRGRNPNPLLLASLYAHAGALDQASAQVDLLAAQNPHNALVEKLKASLLQAEAPPIKTKSSQE